MWNITDYLKNINLWAFEIYTYLSLICIWIIFLLGNTYQCLFYESFTKLVNDFYPGKHIMRILTIWLTNLPFSDQPLHRVDQLTPHMGQVGQKRFFFLIVWCKKTTYFMGKLSFNSMYNTQQIYLSSRKKNGKIRQILTKPWWFEIGVHKAPGSRTIS